MNFSRKKQILALFLLGIAVSAWPLYKICGPTNSKKLALINADASDIEQTISNINKEGSNFTDTMHDEINAEHDRLLGLVQQAFPLADNQWEQMHERLSNIIAVDDLLSNQSASQEYDNSMVGIAQQVLATTGINPKRVTIEIVEKPNSACDACAGQCYRDGKVQHFLQLNSSRLQERNEQVQRALLKHECMHLINYDGLRAVFIETLLKKNGIEESVYRKHPAFCALAKHLEFRADLFASAYDADFAQGLLEGIKEHMEKYPNPPVSLNHPTDQQRYTAIANLMKYMEAENSIKMA